MAEARRLISIVILNYNGAHWLERCLESLRRQTIFDRSQIIVTDNASPDGSAALAAKILAGWPNAMVVQNDGNLGFCEGNNRGATYASGEFILFLNNDTWLEPDCLERLTSEMAAHQAGAGGAMVQDYDSNRFQSIGGTGMDWFGFPNAAPALLCTSPLFATCGCAYVIRKDVFDLVGGFDNTFFLYSDETDLSWRVWIAGHSVIGIPAAVVHHQGAANVNPKERDQPLEVKTSMRKRYYANRNGLLFAAKNAQHILLLTLLPQLCYLLLEAMLALAIYRNLTLIRESYLTAVRDAWRLRHHVMECRRQIRGFRRRGDLWMLRFLRLKPSRWDEVKRLFRVGAPKMSA